MTLLGGHHQLRMMLDPVCLRRLAMLAYAGFIVQHTTTGTTPLKNLSAHLADPWGVNVVSNELSRAGL